VPGLAVLTALMAPATAATEEPAQRLEYRVKAAFLYNFARFVTWPADSPRTSEAVVIGILGKDPFGALLDSTVLGKTVGGKPFKVRRIPWEGDITGCHLVFIAASERRHAERAIAELNGSAVLTVGETDDFLDAGGMIGFVIEDEAVRIDMNLDAARKAGLEVSSQLLLVARTIRQGKNTREAP
jgi:hypothetical protein